MLRHLVQDFAGVFDDLGDSALIELAFGESVIGFNLLVSPHVDRDISLLSHLIALRTRGTVEHGERNVLNVVLFGKCLQLRFSGIGVVRSQDDKASHLLVFVLANDLIHLLDQTGQVVRQRTCEPVHDWTSTVSSAIAQRLTSIRSRTILDVERAGAVTDL